MIFVQGTGMFGRTDGVPGMFYVATRFWHVYYVPVIPSESFIVLSIEGGQFRGVPIGLHGKSLWLAWGRAAATVVAIVCGVKGIFIWIDPFAPNAEVGTVMVRTAMAAGALLLLSYRVPWLTRARYWRACALAERAGFTAEGMERVRRYFGEAEVMSGGRGFPVAGVAGREEGRGLESPAPTGEKITGADGASWG